jgi:hypothetical protein
MGPTKGDEIVRIVQAALGAEIEVVNGHENGISAAWKPAAVVIATEHRPACRRSDGLLRPDARVGASPGAARHGFGTSVSALVDDGRGEQPQVLTVALSHGRNLRPDGHQLPSRLLRCAPALGTHREGDLIARSAFVPGSAEYLARHQQKGRVVVQRLTTAAPQRVHRLAKERERLRRYLEAEHVP